MSAPPLIRRDATHSLTPLPPDVCARVFVPLGHLIRSCSSEFRESRWVAGIVLWVGGCVGGCGGCVWVGGGRVGGGFSSLQVNKYIPYNCSPSLSPSPVCLTPPHPPTHRPTLPPHTHKQFPVTLEAIHTIFSKFNRCVTHIPESICCTSTRASTCACTQALINTAGNPHAHTSHLNVYAHAPAHAHAHTRQHTRMHTHIRTRAHTHPRPHTCTHTIPRPHPNARLHIHKHINLHLHLHTEWRKWSCLTR